MINKAATSIQKPLVIGVAGGTASGKTSVCNEIIKKLQDDPVCVPPEHLHDVIVHRQHADGIQSPTYMPLAQES